MMQVCMLIVISILITAFVLTGDDESEAWTLSEEPKKLKVFAWSMLIFNPISLAILSALSRALRKLDEHTVTTYSNLVNIPLYLIVMLAVGEEFGIFMNFSVADWGYLFGCAFFAVQAQVFNFKAN